MNYRKSLLCALATALCGLYMPASLGMKRSPGIDTLCASLSQLTVPKPDVSQDSTPASSSSSSSSSVSNFVVSESPASSSSTSAAAPSVIKISHDKPIRYDYQSWKDACSKLPAFTNIGSSYANTTLNWAEFGRVLGEFFAVNQLWYHDRAQCWIDKQPAVNDTFFNTLVVPPPFKPFVQKMVIDSDTQVALRGDLHGDIHSLIAYVGFLQKEGHLDGFDIRDKSKFHMVFLGDYVDRGNYGLEVIYTLMRLKIANPDNVTLVRGNHEDTSICNQYGFLKEFETKFGVHYARHYGVTTRMYDFLPVALWLGSGAGQSKDFMQCCHGGMEVGYDATPLLNNQSPIAFSWIEKLDRATEFEKLPLGCQGLDTLKEKRLFAAHYGLHNIAVNNYDNIGFMWSDFQVIPQSIINPDKTIQSLIFPSSRGAGIFEYSKVLTQAILNRVSQSPHKVRGVLRAHQHLATMNDMMESIIDPHNITNHKGLSKLWKEQASHNHKDLWDGIVCTFLVSPDSEYSCKGNLFDFDAFAIMKTADTFDKWKLNVHRNMLKDIVPQTTQPATSLADFSFDEII